MIRAFFLLFLCSAFNSFGAQRSNHAATLLPDGTVLVTGGDVTGEGPINTAEIYDPGTGRSHYTNFPLNVARSQHTATILLDGRVLIAGGTNPHALSSAEIFDPATEQFTLTANMSVQRAFFESVLLNEAKMLVTGDIIESITVHPSGRFAYASSETSNKILGFSINQTTGSLAELSVYPLLISAGASASSINFDPWGRFLYIGANEGLFVFTVNTRTGDLSPLPGSPYAGGVTTALHPSGSFVYSGGNGYRVDPSTGELTPIAGSGFLADQGAVVEPTGRFLYTTRSSGIYGYMIDPKTGSLSPLPDTPIGAGPDAGGITVDPTGRYISVANTHASYSVDAISGGLTQSAVSPVLPLSNPKRTGILTPSGYEDAADLSTGDKVIGYDFARRRQVINTIEKIETVVPDHFNHWLQDEEDNNRHFVNVSFTSYKINRQYTLFRDQSVFANDRMVHAFELSVGDRIYSGTGEPITINDIREDHSQARWLKLSVSGNHTYIADGIIQHNASRYWVGGGSSSNWNATKRTNWGSASNTRDNASIPGASDAVFFDGVGASALDSTISAAITINSLDMTGYANTLTHNSNVALTILGNTFKTSLSMTYTLASSTSSIVLKSGTGTSSAPTAITSNGKTLGNVTINGVGGHFALQDDLVLSPAAALILTNGSFNANNKNVTAGLFSSSNSNPRTLTMGSGIWTLTGNAAVIWKTSTITGLVLNRGNDIVASYSGSTGTRTITAGALAEISAPGFNIAAGADTVAITTNARALNFTGFCGTLTNAPRTVYGNLTLSSCMNLNAGTGAMTFAATSSITTNGKILDFPVIINATGGSVRLEDGLTLAGTRALTLTKGIFDANNKNVTIGVFSSSNSNIRTLTMGAGTWTLNGNAATIWTTATTTGLTINPGTAVVASYSGQVGTRTISTGALNESSAPSFRITGGTDILTITSNVKALNFTGFCGTLTNGVRTLYGDLTVSSCMNLSTGSGGTTFAATSGIRTISSSGKTLPFPVIVNSPGSTLQLADNLTLDKSTLTLTAGAFDANNRNVTAGFFSSSNANPRTLRMGSGTWVLTGNAATMWNTNNSTNLTVNRGNDVVLNYSGSTGTRTINAGIVAGSEANSVGFRITAGADTLSISSNSSIYNLMFDGFRGSVSAGTRNIYGNFSVAPSSTNMTFKSTSITTTVFAATSGTRTITTSGKTLGFPVTIDGTGGTFQLADDLDLGTNYYSILTINGGTLKVPAARTITAGMIVNNSAIVVDSGNLTIAGSGPLINGGSITHNGSGWLLTNVEGLINRVGGSISYTGSTIAVQHDFTQLGTFDLTGKTIAFTGTDSVLTCDGVLGGTVSIAITGSFTNSSGCTISLGFDPGTSVGKHFTNEGTIMAGSGAWTANFASTIPDNGLAVRSMMGADLSGPRKWDSGVLAPNGKIYGVPVSAADILIIDPLNGTATRSTMGANLSDPRKWASSVLGPDGKVYGIPFDATDILIIDPVTGAATRSNMGGNFSGARKWGGGALASNGKIYGMPLEAADILIIDPIAGTTTRSTMGGNFSNDSPGAFKWRRGVLAPNGKIYGIPYDATDILVIDPVSGTATRSTMGANLDGAAKWLGGVLGPDGKIYGIPCNSDDILIIDPVAGTATRSNMGAQLAGGIWHDAVVGPDGKIYGIPNGADDVLVIDPATSTATRSTMGADLSGASQWTDGVLGPDNKIYGIPYNASHVLSLTLSPVPSALTNSGTILTGSDLSVSSSLTLSGGSFVAPVGTLSVSGNFRHDGGSFTHNSGSVTLNGSNQTIYGSTTFHNLTKTMSSAATLTFEAASTQTVEGALTLQGASGNLLFLRSSVPNSQWNLNPQGVRNVAHLDVKDSHNTNSSPIAAYGLNITDSGNNTGWIFGAPFGVTAVSKEEN